MDYIFFVIIIDSSFSVYCISINIVVFVKVTVYWYTGTV